MSLQVPTHSKKYVAAALVNTRILVTKHADLMKDSRFGFEYDSYINTKLLINPLDADRHRPPPV